jgi:hypothetical protein
MERTSDRTNIKVIITTIIIGLLTLSSVTFAADHSNKAEIKFSTIKMEDQNKIETITLLLKGVTDVNFNTESKILTVQYNPEQISCNMILYTISNLGYSGSLVRDNEVVSNE